MRKNIGRMNCCNRQTVYDNNEYQWMQENALAYSSIQRPL